MELKFSKSGTTISVTKGSNRTFMELKLSILDVGVISRDVLIAPLWN